MCSFATERSYNLRRHLKNKFTLYWEKKTDDPIKLSNAVRRLGDGLPRRQPRAEPEDGLYTKEEFEETMDAITCEVSQH